VSEARFEILIAVDLVENGDQPLDLRLDHRAENFRRSYAVRKISDVGLLQGLAD
jgi:hypothetical protein